MVLRKMCCTKKSTNKKNDEKNAAKLKKKKSKMKTIKKDRKILPFSLSSPLLPLFPVPLIGKFIYN